MSTVTFTFCLPVQFREEDGWIIACFPTLDITSQGKTRDEASHNLIEATQLFIESCYERGTLDDVLKACGFIPGLPPENKQHKKDQEHLTVPFELLASLNAAAAHPC